MIIINRFCQVFPRCSLSVNTVYSIPPVHLRYFFFKGVKFFSCDIHLLKPFTMKIPDNAMMVARTALKTSGSRDHVDNEKNKMDHISLLFKYKYHGKEKLIRLVRPANDVFMNTLRRLKSKLIQDSLKEMLIDVTEDVKLDSYNASEIIERTNEEVLYDSEISSLEINGANFRLIRDAPECIMLKIGVNPIVGCPIIASYDLCSGRKPLSHINFHWYVGLKGSDTENTDLNVEGICNYNENKWEYRKSGLYFEPEVKDVGKYVLVTIDLGVDTASRFAVSKLPITRVPEEPLIFAERQKLYCSGNCYDEIRIMSYNILADLYLNLRLPQERLFFSYCPKRFQEYAYRYPLLLRELSGYNADIILLQEVDERFRRRYLVPYMEHCGYDVYFKKKGLVVSEGLAICIRQIKLKALEVFDAWLPDLLNSDLFPENHDVITFLNSRPAFKQHFMSRPAVLQLLLLGLGSDEKTVVLLGNTHLHYHPKQEDIKILQALVCTRYIATVAKRVKIKYPNAKLFKLFAGDFNSTPDCGVFKLISEGSIPGGHEIWKSSQSDGHNVADILGATVSSNLNPMKSLADKPEYTNYTLYSKDGTRSGFSGCLDYIWGDPAIKVKRIIPMPDDELVRKHTALPSVICPSDHLPLICDVQL